VVLSVVPVVSVTVVPVVPVVLVVAVAVVPAVLVTVDWDVAVDGSVVLSVARNNSHCSYWHHWHNRHNSYSDHWNNGKYHRAIHRD
jgi:hypothetical protein